MTSNLQDIIKKALNDKRELRLQSAMCCELTAASCEQSAMSCELTAASCEQSAMSCELPAMSCEQSALRKYTELRTLNSELRTLNYEL